MQKLMQAPHTVKVSVSALAKVAPFAAHNDVRFYLSGIAVIPLAEGGVIACATDGHAILCARDPNGTAARQVILPITNKVNKAAMKAGGNVLMTDDGAIFTEFMGKVTYVVPDGEIKGAFPDVCRVFGQSDQYEPGIRGAFALPLLQKIAGVSNIDPVRFWTKADGSMPGFGFFTIGKDLFGGVMPMRYDEVPLSSIVPPEVWAAPKPVAALGGEG